jgi:tetratricopeptide (TPR) repeat protein
VTSSPARVTPTPAYRKTVSPSARFPRNIGSMRGVFVGRSRELALLERHLDDALEGLGSLVLLRGEAGIGKTRLASALAERAEPRGAAVLWGRSWQEGGAPRGWPFIDLLQHACELPLAAAGGLSTALDALRGPCAPDERVALFDGVARSLAAAAAERPLVLILDDLHWADLWSLQLMKLAVRRLQRARILVIGTYRGLEARLSSESLRALTDLSREAQLLDLGALTEADVAEWAETAGIEPPTTAKIHQTAGGHPFYVGQLIQWVSTGGSVAAERALPLPDGVLAVIVQRLGLLPDDARSVLDLAAVIGSEIDPSLLRQALSPMAPTRIDGAIAALLTHDVLVDDGPRLRFTHDLLRETVLTTMVDRAAAHQVVAGALERCGADSTELARHLLACADPRGVDVAVEAAGRAARRGHDLTAASLLEAALAAGRSRPGELQRSEVELTISAGEAAMRAGWVSRGSERCVEAAELARRLAEGDLLARAALAYGSVVRFGRVDPTLVSLLADAAAVVQDPELALTLEARLSAAMQPSATPEVPLERARATIAKARERGSRALLARVIDLARPAFRALDDVDERVALDEEALALSLELGDADMSLRAEHRLALDMLERGDIAGYDRLAEQVCRIARERGALSTLVGAEMVRVSRASLAGAFSEAEQALRRAAEQYLAMPDPETMHGMNLLPLMRLTLMIARHRLEDRDELLRTDLSVAGPFADIMATVIQANAGAIEAARESLERLVARGDHVRLNFVPAALLPEAIATLGDAPRAALMLPITSRLADRNVAQVMGIAEGAGGRLMGLLFATLERYDEAEAHFARAMALNEAMGALPSLHATQLARAEMLSRRDAAGDRRVAEDLARAALVGFAALGMTARVERARRLCDAAPVAVHPSGAPIATLRRDAEIWTLLHAGVPHRFKDAHGMHYIARLLKTPGMAIHVGDLAAIVRGAAPVSGDAGPALDARAKAEYRRRIADLREVVDEATVFGDVGRADAARRELDFIVAELGRAVGLGGRDRRASSASERTRVNVTMRIRKAITRIADACPDVADHLQRNIATGAFCVYDPPAGGGVVLGE